LVVFVLVLDVSSDEKFIKSNGGDKIPTSPQGFLFIQSMLGFYLFLHPSTAFALDDLHGVGNTVSGCGQEHHVDMVNLDVEFQDFPMFPFADGFKDSFEFAFYLFCSQDFATVSGSPDKMVLQVVEAM